MAKKSILDSIAVPAPCDKSWDEMTGDEQKRFCSGCQKNVFNISAMPHREASRLVADKAGEICIRYTRLPNGRVLTTERKFHQISRRTSVMAAGVIAATMTFSALAPAQTEIPHPTSVSITQTAPEPRSQAKISIIVTDQSGAIIPAVRILLKDIKRNTVTEGMSDDDGLYEFAGIKPSIYEIQIKRDGFKPFVKSDIEFSGEKTLEIKIVLEGILNDESSPDYLTKPIESKPQKTSANISARPIVDLPQPKNLVFLGLTAGSSKIKHKTSNIFLTIYNENGELIPEARITLTNQKTKEVFSILAGNDGEARFSSLIYGKYLMTASSPGFAEDRRIIKLNKKIKPDIKITLKMPNFSQVGEYTIKDSAAAQKQEKIGKSQSNKTIKQRKNAFDTSQISFKILDTSGMAIPEAQVKLTNRISKAEFFASTNESGLAQFGLIPHGRYRLLVSSSQGFVDYEQILQIKKALEPTLKIILAPKAMFLIGSFILNQSEIPLFQSIMENNRGDNEIVKQLISTDFDINTKDSNNKTALHIAVEHDNVEMVRFLLEKGAKVNTKNKSGRTPILMLEEKFDEENSVEILHLLIVNGADINIRNRSKETILMMACEDENIEIVKILLEAKADPNLKDKDGETAMQKTDSDEIKRLLQSYGAH